MRNDLVIFRNTYVKPYYCHTEDINISYPEITNDLAKNPINKPANEEIPILLDYLEPKKPCWWEQPWTNHFTNNLIDKTVNIFISHKEHNDYKLVFKLRQDGIIATFRDFFEQLDLIKIESLLAHNVLPSL